MAAAAIGVDSPATPALPEEVSKPPAGVVLPPRDIRAIIEKTAGYVARNGPTFEDRIRDKEKYNPKFSFLSRNDAYQPFYAWRLNEVRGGRGTAVSAGRVGERVTAAEPERLKGPAAPPDFYFSARMPNINAQDLDVIRLTAAFVAKNGRNFLTTLSQKETGNYQFDFLRPQHSLYQFFSRTVDQYTLLFQAAGAEGQKAQKLRKIQLESNMRDRFSILSNAKQRAEWVKFREKQKQKQNEEVEKEKLEYAQIDWHDFVVVETVLFEEVDDQVDLPPPPSLNDLQSASLEQKAAMSLQSQDRRIEEAMPTDEDYSLFYNQQQQSQVIPSAQSFDTPQTIDHSPIPPTPVAPEGGEDRAIAERAAARKRTMAAQAAAKGVSGQPMRIRNDHVPRGQARKQNVAMALCPNCNQQIPYDELDQHMRSMALTTAKSTKLV